MCRGKSKSTGVACIIGSMSRCLNIRSIVLALLAIAFSRDASADDSWSLTTEEDSVSYEIVASLRQVSNDKILDENARHEIHPVLEFRCLPGRDPTIHFRIDWGRFISSFNTEVGFRVDDGKALWLKLGVDQSNKITLSKSGADAGKLIEKLGAGRFVEIDVAPYSEPSILVRFDISTIDAGLDSLKEACQ